MPVKVRVGEDPEIVVPKDLAAALGLREGDRLVARSERAAVIFEREADPAGDAGSEENDYEKLRRLTRSWFTGIEPVEYQSESRDEPEDPMKPFDDLRAAMRGVFAGIDPIA